MLDKFYVLPSTIARLRSSDAGAFFDDFVNHLDHQGYHPQTIRFYVSAVEHLASWLKSRGSVMQSITADETASFLGHLAKCRCTEKYHGRRRHRGGRASQGVRRFFEFLCQCGVAEPAQAPIPAVVADFDNWMRQTRGTTDATLCEYRLALIALLDVIDSDPTRLNAKVLREFVLQRAKAGFRARPRTDAKALRMFVRFLVATGRCAAGLDAAVPTIASWRLATLPRHIDADDIARVVGSCDVSTAIGLRDRAILLLLARLGLRAGDIRTLEFAHIDWRDGSLRVEGKSRRQTRLPLPQEVGDAVLSYVEKGRPTTPLQAVFVRHLTPIRALRAVSISSIVRLALLRAGVKAPSYGAHLLRHSAATDMLRHGVPMDQIKSVLRHASLETTAIYAKVDTETLRTIVQPWPEVAPC